MPDDLRAAAVEVTHGHPLALTLVPVIAAQHSPDALGSAMSDPDVPTALVSRLLDAVSCEPHRRALEACALAHD